MASEEACDGSGCLDDKQRIVWQNNSNVLSSSVHSSDVTIDTSIPDPNTLGSSAVVVKSITDYPFTVPGHGNGLAVHRSHHFIGYAINKVSAQEQNSMGMVRVIHTANSKRCLIKEIRGLVMDLSFAWVQDQMLLAFTDSTGAFYVYEIYHVEDEMSLKTRFILEVKNDSTNSSLLEDQSSLPAGGGGIQQRQHRVTWCRYVPENPADLQPQDLAPSHLLAVTVGSMVEVWQLHRLVQQTGGGVHLNRSKSHSARLHTFRFSSVVTATAISPDSTCVAVATMDGLVMFYQVDGGGKTSDDEEEDGEEEEEEEDEEEGQGDCVHQWNPHDGEPITCLYFLDNHMSVHADDSASSGSGSFWRFAVTGARNNTELKVWSCKTWTCLQVLRFNLPPLHQQQQLSSSCSPGGAGGGQGQPSASAPTSASHSPSMRCTSLSPSLLQQTAGSSPSSRAVTGPGLLVYIDDTSNYIILTDQARKVLFLVMLDSVTSAKPAKSSSQSPSSNGCVNGDNNTSSSGGGSSPKPGDDDAAESNSTEVTKRVVSVSEIPVQFVPICVVINSAKMKAYQRWKHHTQTDPSNHSQYAESSGGGDDGDGTSMERGLVMQCNILTQKSLLQCSVRLQPSLPSPASVTLPCTIAPAHGNNPAQANGTHRLPESSAEDLLDTTSSSVGDIQDGLTDLSISLTEGDIGSNMAELSSYQSGDAATSTTTSNSKFPALSELLPPTHFTAPTAPPAAAAVDAQTLLASATAKLPPPPGEVPVDPSLNNKANPTLAALLMYPNAGAIIAGGGDAHGTSPLSEQLESGALSSTAAASAMMASLLGISQDSAACGGSSSSTQPQPLPAGEAARAARSSSVPPAAAAAACSSTSSPSLEIQQILQLHDDKSSGRSSSSNSRGPTQLEMAEEDSHLAVGLTQHQHLEEDQPEALQQLTGGAQANNNTSQQHQPASSSAPLSAAGAAASSSSVSSEPRSSSASTDTEEAKQRQAVRQVQQKLLEEQRIREKSREQEKIKQQQMQLHKLQQGKKMKSSSAAAAAPTAAPQGSDASNLVSSTSTEESVASTTVTLVPLPETSPLTASTLQALLPGLGAAATDPSSQPRLQEVVSVLGGGAPPSSQLTCAQLEANMVVGATSGPALPPPPVAPSYAPYNNGTSANSLFLNSLAASSSTPSNSNFNNAQSPYGDRASASNTAANGGVSSSSTSNSILEQIATSVGNNRQAGAATFDSTRFPSSAYLLSSLEATNCQLSTSSHSDVSSPTAATVAAAAAGGAAIHSLMSLQAAGEHAAPGQRAADAVTAANGTSSLQAQAAGGVRTSATTASNTDALTSNAAELKELRTLMLATQQQLNKLSKKLEEVSSTQRSHNSSNNAQVVAQNLRPAVEAAVKNELRQTLPHNVAKGLESSVGQQLPHELQRMVSSTEARMADSITKMLQGRGFTENLSQHVCNAVSPSVSSACRDAYNKLVMPGFSTLTSRILQQFNELFHKGTTEYLQQVKNEVSGVMSCVEKSASNNVREMEASKASVAAMLKGHQDLLQQHTQAMHQHANHVASEAVIRRIVAEEVARVVTVLQRQPPPGTPAPAFYGPGGDKPHSPKQAQLQLEQFIAAKQFNTAFKQALSANDLNQVLFVCERVNRESLMVTGNCKLSQEVLMSLINQLSHDLAQKTDIKMKFLEDALLCIEKNHPVTREHIRAVASCLQQNVMAYLETNPPQQTQNRFRMMLLAVSQYCNATNNQ